MSLLTSKWDLFEWYTIKIENEYTMQNATEFSIQRQKIYFTLEKKNLTQTPRKTTEEN